MLAIFVNWVHTIHRKKALPTVNQKKGRWSAAEETTPDGIVHGGEREAGSEILQQGGKEPLDPGGKSAGR